MRTPRFRYHVARSIDDAAAALAGNERARLLAGGTDLLPNMKRRQDTPELLVSLRRIDELRGIGGRTSGPPPGADQRSALHGETVIGAGTSIADIARSDAIRAMHPALFRAASQLASPLIRNTATLGGNLCLDTRCNYFNQTHEWRRAIDFCLRLEGETCWVAPSSTRCWAVASSDTAPALIALGARITLHSKEGERDLALEDLYADDGAHPLTKRAGEILTSIRIPARGVRSTYWKLRRRGSIDFPVLGVAAAIRFGPHDVVEEARIVLGAVASHPILVPESQSLAGRSLTDDVIEEFAERAASHAKPLDNTDFAMTWRKAVAKTYIAGALRELR
ncbi:MAG TPA: FAD binding domain-containing protein [Thermoanaerobaculia bacterium]|nr:FAD binding domain-containing protein [Thermoanaerobaculia bacterium]